MKLLIIFLIIILVVGSVYLNLYLIGEHYENKTQLIKEMKLKDKALSFIEMKMIKHNQKPVLKTSGGRGHSTVQDLTDYEIELAKYEGRKPYIIYKDEKIKN